MLDFFCGMVGSRPIEWIAVACGILNVSLIIRRSIWNYPFGFAVVTLYLSRPGRLRGALTKRCGWDLCQSFKACIGVRLPKTDCGNCVL